MLYLCVAVPGEVLLGTLQIALIVRKNFERVCGIASGQYVVRSLEQQPRVLWSAELRTEIPDDWVELTGEGFETGGVLNGAARPRFGIGRANAAGATEEGERGGGCEGQHRHSLILIAENEAEPRGRRVMQGTAGTSSAGCAGPTKGTPLTWLWLWLYTRP